MRLQPNIINININNIINIIKTINTIKIKLK